MVTIRMSDFGESLVTRGAGREAYASIVPRMDPDRTVFDFEGVELVTNSFADETFGRLVYENGMGAVRAATTFRNVKPIVAMALRSAMDLRESQRAALAVC